MHHQQKGTLGTIIMSTYSATESSSSKHPGDWGRAMAVALTRLVDQARADAYDIEHHSLYGAGLHLTITEAEHGVQITIQWDPDEPGPAALSGPLSR